MHAGAKHHQTELDGIFSQQDGVISRVTSHFREMKEASTNIGMPFDPVRFLGCRPFKNRLDLVELRPSAVHGSGVFAKKDIAARTLVTFYPGDMVGELNSTSKSDKEATYSVTSNKDKLMRQCGTEKGRTFLEKYKTNFDATYYLIGDPENISDPTYLGHMINDGARSHSFEDQQVYMKIAALKMNVGSVPLEGAHLSIVALRDIRQGEELFMPYGIKYWESEYTK